jgi:hypothetical protein
MFKDVFFDNLSWISVLKTQASDGDKKRPKVEQGNGLADQRSRYSAHLSREQVIDTAPGISNATHIEPDQLPKELHEMRIQDDGVSSVALLKYITSFRRFIEEKLFSFCSLRSIFNYFFSKFFLLSRICKQFKDLLSKRCFLFLFTQQAQCHSILM